MDLDLLFGGGRERVKRGGRGERAEEGEEEGGVDDWLHFLSPLSSISVGGGGRRRRGTQGEEREDGSLERGEEGFVRCASDGKEVEQSCEG